MALDIPPEIDLSLIFERDDVMAAFMGHCAKTHCDQEDVRRCQYCAQLRAELATAITEWLDICQQEAAARMAGHSRALAQLESDKNWLRAQRDVAEERIAEARAGVLRDLASATRKTLTPESLAQLITALSAGLPAAGRVMNADEGCEALAAPQIPESDPFDPSPSSPSRDPENQQMTDRVVSQERLTALVQYVTNCGEVVHTPAGAWIKHPGYRPNCPLCVEEVQILLSAVPRAQEQEHDQETRVDANADACDSPTAAIVTGDTSDGYHTFNELYAYRKAYNALLFNEWAAAGKHDVHKSRRHSDGEACFGGGWFVVSAQTPQGQITNHYEDADWPRFQVPERERAAPWDGHTPQIALERLLALSASPILAPETSTASSANRCLVCRTDYPTGGQQAGPVWALWGPTFRICKRCVAAGRQAKHSASPETPTPQESNAR